MEMDLQLILEISCASETNVSILRVSNDDSRRYYHQVAERIVVTKDFLSGKGFQHEFSSLQV